MKKKTYKVLIKTSFDLVVDIEATSEEKALEKANDMVFNGEVDPVSNGEPDTECSIW